MLRNGGEKAMLIPMPHRRLRFIKDNFYHVFNRGNYKSAIFFNDHDYQRFLEKLKHYKDLYKTHVVAYALMPNHFHLLLEPKADESLAAMLKDLQSSHSHYLSVKHSLQGHLFQGPFKAKLIADEASFLQIFRYISLQPIKEKILQPRFIRKGDFRILRETPDLVRELRSFRWGSYQGYLNPKNDNLIAKDPVTALLKTPQELSSFVESKLTIDDVIGIEAMEIPPPQRQDPGF